MSVYAIAYFVFKHCITIDRQLICGKLRTAGHAHDVVSNVILY